MGTGAQSIKDPETEAGELQKVLRQVGRSLQKSSSQRNKTGLSYAQFKTNFLQATMKAAASSHVVH